MKNWQQLTRQANAKFHQKALSQAKELYQQALQQAEEYICTAHAGDNEVMALVVSYFNLADLYLELGLLPQAHEQLLTVHQRLASLLHQPEASQQLKQAAFNASRKTVMQLTLFSKNYGEDYALPVPVSEEQQVGISTSTLIH